MSESVEIRMMESWYTKSYVLYEILFCNLFDRETAFLKPKHRRVKGQQNMFRYCKIFKPEGITYYLNQEIDYKGIGSPLQTYYSLGKYTDGIPHFQGSPFMRKAKTDEWNENRWKQCESYDLLIDIDSPDREHVKEARQDAIKITQYLDSFKMPYYLRYSGMGYHVVIPHRFFQFLNYHFDPHQVDGNSIYELYNLICKKLSEKFTELIDLGLHDSVRVTKVPYSLAFYPDGCYVCWPFKTREEFYASRPDDYKISSSMTFSGEQKIFRRGQTLFNQNDWVYNNTFEFLKSLKIEVEEHDTNRSADEISGV